MLEFRREKLKVVNHEKSDFTIAELSEYLDFEVKRVYFIQDVKLPVGNHCHRVEKEFFILVKGFATVVIDQGNGLEEYPFQEPGDAVYVGNYVWHGFKEWSPDFILLALSSVNYDPHRSGYIENYDEYRRVLAEMKR